MRVILVERAPTPDDALAKLDRCFAVREIVALHRFVGEAIEVAVYTARDAERVREAHRSAGVDFVRAWAAETA